MKVSPAPDVRTVGKRRARVDATRRRIIEAARRMFGEDGFHAVGLEDVARRARVGRKTIYYQFGSKLGLLEALVADMGERSRIGESVEAALGEPDLARAVRRFVDLTCSLWEEEQLVVRALLTLATFDSEAREVVDRVNGSRRRDLGRLTARARRTGRLRSGWSSSRAADSLWLLTSPEPYDVLRRSGASAGDAIRLICDLCLSLFENGKE